jgi:acetyltransferase
MEHQIITKLKPIFYPETVAVIGASNRKGNFGRSFVVGLVQMGFEKLYVVHPTEGEVLGIKSYRRVEEIPGKVDMAVVVSPSDTVPQIIRGCSYKGVKGVVIFTAGFAEKGSHGRVLEQEILDIARRGNTRIIGPNCMGIYCPASRLATYPGLPKENGSVGMISHSGSLSVMTIMAAMVYGIRFSKVVSSGNECDLNASDFLEYLGRDPETRIIIAYLETVREGRRFFHLAREISREKPIIIWKSGITDQGARAASSHTGALAVPVDIWRAAMTQAGIINAHSAEEMLDYLQAFYYLPIPSGRRVAIISGPGGPAVATTDACIVAGLELPEFSLATKKRLSKVLPSVGTNIDNPIDLGMGSDLFPEWYSESIKALGKDDMVDMVLIISGSGDPRSDEMVKEAIRGVGKPVVFVAMPGHGSRPEQCPSGNGIAVYPDGNRAAMALGGLVSYANFKNQA